MKKCFGLILVVLSLACILTVVVRTIMGWSGVWSAEAIGGYVFHPLTMLAGMWLLKPLSVPSATPDASKGGA
jgi:hypothetical protein